MYRILTNRGYYFTVGHGRYGRVNGLRAQAEALCEAHAAQCVKMLKPYGLRPIQISISAVDGSPECAGPASGWRPASN